MSIAVKDLSYTYSPGTPAESAALTDISLDVERGEWISIVGHTGSGKSTLAQHLNLLILPQSGTVSIDGIPVTEKSKKLRELRRKVGLVFQYPEQQFFAETVREEIAFAPRNWGLDGDDLERAVQEAVLATGLDPALLDSNPFALSGGQRRRVALASVISMNPDYLVLDEPTAGLDAKGVRELVKLLQKIRVAGLAVVQVTHDLGAALLYSDRIFVLEGGRGVVFGSAEEVAEYLLHNPVRGLVIPPLVQFVAGLRTHGVRIPLTSDVRAIVAAVENVGKGGAAK